MFPRLSILRILSSLILCILVLTPVSAQQKRPLTATDIWNIKRLGGLDLSPDGKTAAIVVTKTDVKENKSNGDIYLVNVESGAVRQFTTGKTSEGSPQWSPDGERIVFTAKRDDNERAQLYLISVHGGEAMQITDLPLGAASPKWLPDGKRIAFVSEMLPKYGANWDSLKAEIKRRKDSKVSAKTTENRLARYWDHYMTDGYLQHIYTVDVESRKIVDLTPSLDRLITYDGDVSFDVSPDGKEIAFTGLTKGEPYDELEADVFTVPTDGSGNIANLTAKNPADDFSPVYGKDGKYLLFGQRLHLERNAERVKLMRMDRKTGEAVELCRNFDRDPGDWESSDDGKTVYFTAGDLARQSLFSVSMGGGEVTRIFHSGTNSGLSLAGRTLLFLHQNLSAPSELYRIGTDGKNLKKLTSFNEELLAGIEMGRTDEAWFKGADGDDVQMFIVYPPGFDSTRKWPLLVLVHGGPHGTFGDDFHPRWNAQAMAAPGYVAIMPNFHGSTSFGERFAECINGAHGDKPFTDVTAATDAMLRRGFIDSTRMAVAGGSYGGYLTAWVGSQTNRYACLIDHAGVYNLMAQFASDITHHRDVSYGGAPWTSPENVMRWSPAQYSRNYVTPTLILHGEKDYRVPYTQGLELYGVLKAKGVPARLVVYPDENHWILSAQNSIHWYGEFHSWLERWLKRPSNP